MSQQTHWRDSAINASEAISDGFEVLKAYGARIAEWVLFFCLIANIIEIFPLPEPFASIFGGIVLGTQSVTLDIAGFGLTTMGDHAKRRGDLASARKATAMGWALIIVMIVTVGLVTTSVLIPSTKPIIDMIDKGLILLRVVITVLYGHIVHSLRNAGVEHDNRVGELQKQLDDLQKQLDAKAQEASGVQSKLSSVQSQVSSLSVQLDTANREVSTLQLKLDAANQQVSTLENELSSGQGDTAGLHRVLSNAQVEMEALRGRLEAKTREVETMRADLAGVIELRRELNATKLNAEDLRAQFLAEQRTVSSLRRELAGVQSQVSSQKVSTGHKKSDGGHLDTGHAKRVDTPVSSVQSKVVELDSRRGKTGRGDSELAEQIKQLLADNPGISGRQIAEKVGCSPTTASEWKKFFESGGQLAANG